MQTRSAEEIETATEKLLQDVQTVVHDGEELLKASAQDLSKKGMAARRRLQSALGFAKETGRKPEEHTVVSARATGRMVREYPYQSLGAAIGIGMLVGMLLSRK